MAMTMGDISNIRLRKIPAEIYYVKYCLAVGQGNKPT